MINGDIDSLSESRIRNTLIKWVAMKQANRNLDDYFIKHGYTQVAIYGFGDLGKLLFKEIKNSKDIHIAAIIDKNADFLNVDLGKYNTDIIAPSENFPHFDAMIITTLRSCSEVCELMRNKTDRPIIMIDDVLAAS